jgi:hypothetical protein
MSSVVSRERIASLIQIRLGDGDCLLETYKWDLQ